MIMSSKKKPASIIVAKMSAGKPEQVSQGPEVEQDASIGLESAAEEILSAIESKDAKALKSAICSMLDMYESKEDAAEESEAE